MAAQVCFKNAGFVLRGLQPRLLLRLVEDIMLGMDYEALRLILAFVGGIAAGFVGSVSSGGGLVNIPLLIFLGLPVDVAIGTNRISGFALFFSALPRYHAARKIDWNLAKIVAPAGLVAGVIGSQLVLHIPDHVLERTVGIILIALLPLILMGGGKKGLTSRATTQRSRVVGYLLHFLVMVYAGFFGGGAGILMVAVFVHFFGLTYIKANATGLVGFLLIGIATGLVFVLNGLVSLPYALMVGAGTVVGAKYGVAHALSKGNTWVRIVYIAVLVISSLKLLFF